MQWSLEMMEEDKHMEVVVTEPGAIEKEEEGSKISWINNTMKEAI